MQVGYRPRLLKVGHSTDEGPFSSTVTNRVGNVVDKEVKQRVNLLVFCLAIPDFSRYFPLAEPTTVQ